MKRLTMLLGLCSIVGALVVPTALSGSQKVPIYAADGCTSDLIDTTMPVPGHVNLNTPGGAVALVVNGSITLAPNTTYTFWVRNLTGYTGPFVNSSSGLGYYAPGTFTTDAYGNGVFHYNFLASDLPPGTYPIQVAINQDNGTTYGCTIAGTTFSYTAPPTSVTVGA